MTNGFNGVLSSHGFVTSPLRGKCTDLGDVVAAFPEVPSGRGGDAGRMFPLLVKPVARPLVAVPEKEGEAVRCAHGSPLEHLRSPAHGSVGGLELGQLLLVHRIGLEPEGADPPRRVRPQVGRAEHRVEDRRPRQVHLLVLGGDLNLVPSLYPT
eukprot:CAMPEP_0118947818 /NCGR_PEP_ID=MMETSP1169-20130426/46703_1 /TAXON_ID=36882 /ORGANISM="Pyramimonas obovata, Strain CCMP722" /LENGTH=153 /DNA_ID=CAMNT_0006894107 /DNA_START=1119 /DNA_END=1581 /DNA_ORIENTATION=-